MERPGVFNRNGAGQRRFTPKKASSPALADTVVIGCSAGGVETLTRFFKALRPDSRAAFFIVIHVAPHADSVLPQLITRISRLPAQHAVDKAAIQPGRVYIAPPDYHLLLEGKRMVLSHGPRENRHRPAIDPLFRTAAQTLGSRVIGIILSGSMDDGSMGLKEIKRKGGVAIVQDPAEALFPDMPRNALAAVNPDFCLPVSEIGSLLSNPGRLRPALEDIMKRRSKDRGMKPESKKIKTAHEVSDKMGAPSLFVCPECSGPLWEIKDGGALLYRCLVGHAYAPENLFAAQTEEVERALWVALRSLEERVELHRQMAERSKKLKQSLAAKQFTAKAEENAAHAKVIRGMLEKM